MPLSANYGDGFSPLIAMVGGRGTGKTVYLTVLASELLNKAYNWFGADVWLSGDSQGTSGSPRQWLAENVEFVYKRKKLFEQTPRAPGGRKQPLILEWRREVPPPLLRRRELRRPFRPARAFKNSYLSFYDTAGEDLGTARSANDLAYLGACDALILLLDPFMLDQQAPARLHLPKSAITSTESMHTIITKVTESLRQGHSIQPSERIKIPVAVAFAKMDEFFPRLPEDHYLRTIPPHDGFYDEEVGRNTHEHLVSLLADWGGQNVEHHFDVNYENYRYFCVSALGAPPDYDKGEVVAGGVRPIRVDEPLAWLLSQFKVIPRGRAS
jgi:hypothetical protein